MDGWETRAGEGHGVSGSHAERIIILAARLPALQGKLQDGEGGMA